MINKKNDYESWIRIYNYYNLYFNDLYNNRINDKHDEHRFDNWELWMLGC